MTATSDLNLEPREPLNTPRSGSPRKRWFSIALLVAVIATGGVIVAKFLTDAVDYFCTLEELGERDGCEAGGRIRVMGTVEEGSLTYPSAGTTNFTITDNGKELKVRYQGRPAGMFAECEPVVVHGVLAADGVFDGDNIDVRHDNEYEAENPGVVDTGGPNC